MWVKGPESRGELLSGSGWLVGGRGGSEQGKVDAEEHEASVDCLLPRAVAFLPFRFTHRFHCPAVKLNCGLLQRQPA